MFGFFTSTFNFFKGMINFIFMPLRILVEMINYILQLSGLLGRFFGSLPLYISVPLISAAALVMVWIIVKILRDFL